MNADEAISTLLKLKETNSLIEILFTPTVDCTGVPSTYMNAPGIFVRVVNPSIHPGGFSAEVAWPGSNREENLYVPFSQCFHIKQVPVNSPAPLSNNTYGKVKLPLGWTVYEGGRAKANG